MRCKDVQNTSPWAVLWRLLKIMLANFHNFHALFSAKQSFITTLYSRGPGFTAHILNFFAQTYNLLLLSKLIISEPLLEYSWHRCWTCSLRCLNLSSMSCSDPLLLRMLRLLTVSEILAIAETEARLERCRGRGETQRTVWRRTEMIRSTHSNWGCW